MKDYVMLAGERIYATDIMNADYLSNKEKEFMLNCYFNEPKQPVKQEPKQKEMLIKRTSYSADLRDKRWYESMEDFIERTIREGKYKTHTSYEKSKEVSRLIYTKSLFDNGIVENNIEVLIF